MTVKQQAVTRDIDGKTVGKIQNDCYWRTVSRKKHFMKMYHGWGIDKSILEGLQERGVIAVCLHSPEEEIDYTAGVNEWLKKGRVADFGHGIQVFLNESCFLKEHYGKKSNTGGW